MAKKYTLVVHADEEPDRKYSVVLKNDEGYEIDVYGHGCNEAAALRAARESKDQKDKKKGRGESAPT